MEGAWQLNFSCNIVHETDYYIGQFGHGVLYKIFMEVYSFGWQ